MGKKELEKQLVFLAEKITTLEDHLQKAEMSLELAKTACRLANVLYEGTTKFKVVR